MDSRPRCPRRQRLACRSADRRGDRRADLDGVLKLIEHNARFDEVIAQTGDEAMMSGDFRDCIHLQIAHLMSDFLADLRQRERARFLRRRGDRRAPFPDQAGAAVARPEARQPALPGVPGRPHGRGPRRALAARRNAARQPDRPAQSLELYRGGRGGGRSPASARGQTMPCWWSTCGASAGSTN